MEISNSAISVNFEDAKMVDHILKIDQVFSMLDDEAIIL